MDQGSHFSDPFILLDALDSIKLNKTGIEAHNSQTIFERYYELIRTTLRNIMVQQHPKSESDLVLALSFKEIKFTAGPDGCLPLYLVFG